MLSSSIRGRGQEDQSLQEEDDSTEIREIHALTSPSTHARSWSSNFSIGSIDSDNFTTMSREFNALVAAGSTAPDATSATTPTDGNHLRRIGEEEEQQLEETNPLAIVPDRNPIPSTQRAAMDNNSNSNSNSNGIAEEQVSVHRVKEEETESKIAAWQTAEIAKINNRFKREEVVISGWESEKVETASAWLKKVERKLEEQRARAVEKMQNKVAKARRKAEEKKAEAEAKRGTKVAKVMEMAKLLRAVGRTPSKRSFLF